MKIIIPFLFFLTFHQHLSYGQTVKTIKWAELNQKIKQAADTTLIINFWATWCKPCVAELPSFEAVNKQLKNKKTQVWLVSLDFENSLNSKLKPFLEQNPQSSKIFLLAESDLDQIISQINAKWTGAIPATLIIKGQKRRFFEGPITTAQLLKSIE
jgi:thiol-disulfide isomerase/thioredoxin